jgi:hypothetical protein
LRGIKNKKIFKQPKKAKSTFCLALPRLLQDVRAWLAAVSADRQAGLAAERIARTVIRGGRPARMSESHAGTS